MAKKAMKTVETQQSQVTRQSNAVQKAGTSQVGYGPGGQGRPGQPRAKRKQQRSDLKAVAPVKPLSRKLKPGESKILPQ